jgi:hypothetical protein
VEAHFVHLLSSVLRQSTQLATALLQQALFSTLMKAGSTQLMQISSSLKSQSLHLSIGDLQQVLEFLLKKPHRHPRHTSGAVFTHLLQFPTLELQQARKSTLK